MQSLYRATRPLPLLLSRYRHSASADPFRKVQQPPDWVGRAEPIAHYQLKGYHPTRVGDVFGQEGRYHIVSKLGWGAYSTVWLARDTFSSDGTAVALKIMHAELSYIPQLREAEYLQQLRDKDPQNPGHSHVVQLWDAFPHNGPNGRHECLVSEALCWDIDRMRKYGLPSGRMPLVLAKKVMRETLYALDYAHNTCGIIHTDVKPNNMMIYSGKLLVGDSTPETIEYTAVQPDGSAIILTNISPCSFLPNDPEDPEAWDSCSLKLGDWGVACYTDKVAEHWAPLICSPALRPPEVVVGAGWGKAVDIWSLGCCLYEMLVGQSMLAPDIPEEIVPYVHRQIFGDYPMSLINRGQYSEKFFKEDGSVPEYFASWPRVTIEKAAKKDSGGAVELSPDCVDLLKRMLTYEPDERASIQELLLHAFLLQ